jgi:(R,R)-butanediol dehydrogenase/meso-butanediol dehydrogenase/diacetyl reductase
MFYASLCLRHMLILLPIAFRYSKPSFIPLKDPHPLSGEKVPTGFGHEFSGTVVEIGSKAKHGSLQLGDKVAVFPIYSCNSCQTCEQGLINSCSKFGCHGMFRFHLRSSSS